MQAVYYVNGSEVDTFINTIKKLVQDGEELTITVTSEGKAQLVTSIMDEKEQLFTVCLVAGKVMSPGTR